MTLHELLNAWEKVDLYDKARIVGKFLKDVESKVYTSNGYATIEDIFKDLELSRKILIKWQEEEDRGKVVNYIDEFKHNLLQRRSVKILCDLRDVSRSSSSYRNLCREDKKWLKEKRLRKIKRSSLLRLVDIFKQDELACKSLLKSMRVRLPIVRLTYGKIHAKIENYEHLQNELKSLSERRYTRGLPDRPNSNPTGYTFHGLKAELVSVGRLLQETIAVREGKRGIFVESWVLGVKS